MAVFQKVVAATRKWYLGFQRQAPVEYRIDESGWRVIPDGRKNVTGSAPAIPPSHTLSRLTLILRFFV
jgi:hypothetical protein